MAPIRVYVGVDGGGTKTAAAALVSPGLLLYPSAPRGSSNPNAVGEAAAREALAGAVRDAIELARANAVYAGSIAPGDVHIAGVCLCLSGCDSPADVARTEGWIAEDLPELKEHGVNVTIHNDAVAALAAGTGGALAGLVLIAGTGTIALGYAPDGSGRRARAAGWGPTLGDRGSGYDIGASTLSAVCRAADGRGSATSLTGAVLRHLGLPAERDLIGFAYGTEGWAHVAALAPLCFAAAKEGDASAKEICDAAADELAASVLAVARALGLTGEQDTIDAKGGFPLVMSGGVLSEGGEIAPRLIARLAASLPAARAVWASDTPAAGAARLAQRLAESEGSAAAAAADKGLL